MIKLIEWIDSFPNELQHQYNRGIVSTKEYNVATEFHTDVKALYKSYLNTMTELSPDIDQHHM